MSFDQAFAMVLRHEGGYSDNPQDPGGETNLGISKRSYPNEDIKGMTTARAREIYERDFWLAAGCDKLPGPVALIVFDCAVNAGVGHAVKWLQTALGVAADGKIGPKTIHAATEVNTRTATTRLTRRRIMYYASLSTFPTFGNGWILRSLETLVEANA